MKCKRCNLEIDEKSIYCPYCGEKVKKESDYIDPFASYRNDSSHEKQYEYQQDYSNDKNDLSAVKESNLISKKSYSLIGLLLSIASIFCCLIHTGLGISILAISLVFIICGFRYSKRGMKVASILTLILSSIIVVIISVILWFFSLSITLENGMEYTIKEYLSSIFFNSFYSDKIYGMWMDESKEILDLREDFSYTFYDESLEIISKGRYRKTDGYKIGKEDYIYSDREFYFFEFKEEAGNLLNGETLVLCLDKKDFKRMVFYFPERNMRVETEKIFNLPNASKSLEEIPGIIG